MVGADMATNMAKRSRKVDDPPTHEEDPLLSIAEVARQLGKSYPTVLHWVNDGLLKSVRSPSGLKQVRKSEVNKFLGGSALDKEVE